MGALEGQVTLVTGAGSGLGRAITERFVAEGAAVVAFDRAAEKLAELAARHGDRVRTLCGDVRSLADNVAAVAAGVEAFGRLDCAVGNAGIWDYSASLAALPAERIDASFDEVFQVNVKGYLLLAKAALPALVRSSGGLVFTVSNAGFHPNGGGPLYTASKHAVVGLIRQLAFELAPHVRVNGVAPGPIQTDLRGPEALDMAGRSISSLDLPGFAAASIPAGRVPDPEEYAGAYVFYASRRDSAPATGGVLTVDAGIGVRGIGMAAGGAGLKERFGSWQGVEKHPASPGHGRPGRESST